MKYKGGSGLYPYPDWEMKMMRFSKEEPMMEPSDFRTMNPIGVLQKDEIGVPKAWKGVWFWAPHCWD